MEAFLEELATGVRSFNVKLHTKSLRVNKKDIVKDGKPNVEIPKFDGDIISYLDELYDDYAHSIPHENDNNRHVYFTPLSYEELSDEDLMFGEPRNKARLKLEAFVMLIVMQKGWEELFGNNFFYQSKNFPNFVIYSGWFKAV